MVQTSPPHRRCHDVVVMVFAEFAHARGHHHWCHRCHLVGSEIALNLSPCQWSVHWGSPALAPVPALMPLPSPFATVARLRWRGLGRGDSAWLSEWRRWCSSVLSCASKVFRLVGRHVYTPQNHTWTVSVECECRCALWDTVPGWRSWSTRHIRVALWPSGRRCVFGGKSAWCRTYHSPVLCIHRVSSS